MAGQGYVLDIDAKFLTNLQKADEALNKSVSAANALSSQFVNMVRNSGSYSQGVHNLLESLTRLGSVKIDPVTGLQALSVKSRNAKDSLDLVAQRTSGLRERWKELTSEIGKTKGNDRWRMRITDEKDLTNIQALTTAVKSIDHALTKSTAKTKLTEVQRQQLVEQKAIYKSLLDELKMTDAQRIQSEIATNNKIVADATRRADAVIREKRREVNEAIQLARTSSTKAQLDSAYTALTDASKGLNPNIKSEQLMLQRLSNAQDEVIRKYFEIEKAKKKTAKDAHTDAKEARALASTARSAEELSRAYIEVSRAKSNINPDTKRGQAEIQRLERTLEALQKRMEAVNRSTPQNALTFASYAQTPQELTQAKGYLKTAMQDVADPALMKQLNDAYNAVIAKAKELKSISSAGDASAMKNSIDEMYKYALALSKGARTAGELRTAIAAVQNAQTSCNTATSEGMNRLNTLVAAERRLTNELAKKNGEMTTDQKETVNSAIAYAQSAQGALQLSNAYIKLRSASKNINPKTAEGQEALKRLQEELDKVDKKLRQSSTNANKMRDSLGRIGQTAKTAFGLYAVRQFASGLLKIHGQFEKINISLKVLLGSTARAEQLWNKITKLALKSPFTITQLAEATKQMAAYRIESNKLYQSTKMLADISAGLGVEMSRLILAYGQVKAANFLRATELRQFSEAGIDMLGQLAAYFSEVEGKAIRASEVFEMISKRKVMFEDVDEVLRRVTSSGGVFYEMQEQQAKTLSGQISNLKDSLQMMFHEIGSANHGLIVDIVKKLKWLIDNWEKWLPAITAVISALLTVKAVGLAMAILKPIYIGVAAALNAMGVKAVFAANAMRILKSLTPWGWATMVIGAVMSVVTALTVFDGAEEMAADAGEELGEILSDVGKIFSEQSMKLHELGTAIINYSKLIDNLKKKQEDENTTEQERLELSNAIQDALEARSAIMTDLANRNSEMAASVGELINGEREFIEVEKELRELFAEEVMEEARKATTASKMDISEEELNKYNDSYTKLVANVGTLGGNRAQSISDAFKLIRDDSGKAFFDEIDKYVKDVDEYTKIIDDTNKLLQSMFYDASTSLKGLKKANDTKEEVDQLTDFREKEFGYDTAYSYYDIIKTFLDAKAAIDKKIKAGVTEWLSTHGITDVTKMTQEQKEAAVRAFDDIIAEYNLKEEAVRDFERQLSNLFGFKWFHVQDPLQPWQESFNNFMRGSTEILDLTIAEIEALDGEYALITDSNKTQEGMIEALDQKIEECKKIIALSATYTDAMYAAGQTLYTAEEVSKAKEELPIAERARSYFPAKSKKSGGKTKDDYIDEAARGIRELHKAYKDMQKTFGDGTANTGAWERYGKGVRESLKNAKINADSFLKTVGDLTSEDSVVKAFDELIKRTKNQKKKAELELAKGEFIWEMKIEADAKAFSDAMTKAEELIAGYELGVELDKLHIPHDFAQDFFDIDITELPELRLQVMAQYEGLEIGSDEQKQIEETLRRIDEIETKAQQERLKKYLEYSRNAIGERGKILLEEIEQLQEIEKAFELTNTLAFNKDLISSDQKTKLEKLGKSISEIVKSDEAMIEFGFSAEQIDKIKEFNDELKKQEEIAKEGVQRDTAQKLDEFDFEQFKGSDVFQELYSDLENASSSALEVLIGKLDEHSKQWADLPIDQVKEYTKLLKEASDALASNKMPKDIIEDQMKIIKNSGYSNIGEASKVMAEAQLEKEKLEKERSEAEAGGKSADEIAKFDSSIKDQDKIISATKAYLNAVKNVSEAYKKQVENIKKVQDNVNLVLDGWDAVDDLFGEGTMSSELLEMARGVSDATFGMKECLSNTKAAITAFKNAEEGAQAFGYALDTASGIIGIIVIAIKAAVALFNFFKDSHNNNLQKDIDAHLAKVEKLQSKYEDLERQIDKAFTTDSLSKTTTDMNKNLEEQKQKYEAAIASTKDQKATSEEEKAERDAKIAEYEKNIAELDRQIAENTENLFSTLTDGILDNVLDATRSFVDAWYDAFKETGNGMNGLKDTFKDMLLDMLKQQAATTLISPFIEKLQKQIYDSVMDDNIFDADEASTTKEMWEEMMPQIDESLKNYFEAFEGVIGQGEGGLSDLQKGIQGMTEDQAEVLAAYWNSCRFMLANIDTNLAMIAADVLGQKQSDSPIVSAIKEQTAVVKNIREMLSGVISHDGKYVNVYMQ